MGDTINSYITEGKTRAQMLGKLPKGYPHSKGQRRGLHPSLISKALNCRDWNPTGADMAETSSFPKQWLVPLALAWGRVWLIEYTGHLKRGILEEKGYKVCGLGKNTCIPLSSPLLPINAQPCSIFRCLKLPDLPPEMDHLAHCELFAPPQTAQQRLPLLPLSSASWATSPLKPFPYTVGWLTGFLLKPK